MKYAGIKNKFSIIAFLITLMATVSFAYAQDADTVQYEERINELFNKGVISRSDARAQIINIRLKNTKDRKVFKGQVRGVASSLKDKKVFQFNNEPIEIPSN